MKPLPAKKLVKILRKNGFILSRQKGSHQIWKNPRNGIIVPVPLATFSNDLEEAGNE